VQSGKTPIVLALWAHHDGRMNRILTSLPLPPRLRDLGWGVLLVPALLLIVNIFGRGIAWEVTAALAVAATLLAPAVAADMVAAAVLCLGLYAAFLTGWMVLDLAGYQFLYGLGPGLAGWNPMSEVFFTSSGSGVLLDVVKTALILGFGVWLVPRTIGVHSGLARRNAALAARATRLAETRGTAVDTAAAELRRLERNLHDGAQARLVALGINLRAAEQLFKTDPGTAVALVAESRENSALALAELRALVRGFHPPVLADRGLAAAVQGLALGSPIPVQTDIQLPGRPPAPVESAAYFAVAEALTNGVKHSGASAVHIRMAYCAGMLRIEVTDDGHGGADPANGTGLLGVERRVATFDGILAVSSPPGGPTIVVIEVPCALSSPKTCSS
jgi:signal transduction histidine kinase